MNEYEAILNMTDEQAANLLEDFLLHGVKVGGRGNGKTLMQLTYNTAIIKAVNKLRGTPNKEIYLRCLRCGRTLKNPDARERGYGDVCWKKHLQDTQTTLL